MINSRQKGHAWERKIAQEMREIGFSDCITKREARGGDWSTTDDGIDLINTGPFAIQCKRLKHYVPVNTIEEIKQKEEMHSSAFFPFGIDKKTGRMVQAKDSLPSNFFDCIPLLLTKADHKPIMAVIPWEELKKLISKKDKTITVDTRYL